MGAVQSLSRRLGAACVLGAALLGLAAGAMAETTDAAPAAPDAAATGAAPATGTTAPNAATPPAPPANPNRMRCVYVTPTGSNIPQRVCKTERQWAELRRRAEEQQRQLQDQRASCSQGGGGGFC
ncbi:MAG: hypothetical protein U1E50_07180 [Caulobacteraceae bacterium]